MKNPHDFFTALTLLSSAAVLTLSCTPNKKISVHPTASADGIICERKEPHTREEKSRALYDEGFLFLAEKGDVEKAAECFEKSLRYDKRNAESLDSLSFCLIEMGKYEKAASCARKASLFSENAWLHGDKITFKSDSLIQAGEAYLLLGKEKQAQKVFSDALESNSDSYNVSLGIAATYIRTKNPAAGKTFFEKEILGKTHEKKTLAVLYLNCARLALASGSEEEGRNIALQSKIYALEAGYESLLPEIDRMILEREKSPKGKFDEAEW